MSNLAKVIPSVSIELMGKTYEMVFDMLTHMRIEQKTGKNMLAGEAFQSLTATDLVVLVWASIRTEEKLTLEDVAMKFSMADIPRIMDAIAKAQENSAVSPEQAEKKDVGQLPSAAPTP